MDPSERFIIVVNGGGKNGALHRMQVWKHAEALGCF